MVVLRNNFDAHAEGTTVTAANSGGSNGNALNSVSNFNTMKAVAAAAFAGARGLEIGASGGGSSIAWNATATGGARLEAWTWFYIRIPTALPSSMIYLATYRNAAGVCARLTLNSTGKIGGENAATTGGLASTTSLAADTWYRIEFYCRGHATTGAYGYRIRNASTNDLIEERISGNTNTRGTIDSVTLQSTVLMHYDEIGFTDLAWPGPPVVNLYADDADEIDPGQVVSMNVMITDIENEATTVAWTQLSGPTVTLSSTTTPVATFIAPFNVNGAALSFRATVTDTASNVTTKDMTFTVNPATWVYRKSGGVLVKTRTHQNARPSVNNTGPRVALTDVNITAQMNGYNQTIGSDGYITHVGKRFIGTGVQLGTNAPTAGSIKGYRFVDCEFTEGFSTLGIPHLIMKNCYSDNILAGQWHSADIVQCRFEGVENGFQHTRPAGATRTPTRILDSIFKVVNVYDPNYHVDGMHFIGSTDFLIENCIVDISEYPIDSTVTALLFIDSAGGRVSNMTFRNNILKGTGPFYTIAINGADNVVFENNFFVNPGRPEGGKSGDPAPSVNYTLRSGQTAHTGIVFTGNRWLSDRSQITGM